MTDYLHLLRLPESKNAPDGWVYWICGDTGPIKLGRWGLEQAGTA